jgi:putative ABC transport system substrate-binding protein
MRRREFIALLGGAAAARPLAARAQQPVVPVIGYLDSVRLASTARVTAFRQALSETGYVEGQNVAIEYRSADNQFARLPSLADELVGRQVAVIFAPSARAALAAKAATTTIPIVFFSSADPVESGLVASLNRPGGNLTGAVTLNVEVGPKRLELLHEVVPTATIIALLVNPTSPTTETQSRDAQATARALGLRLQVLHASTEHDFDTVFSTLTQVRAGALVIGIDSFLGNRSELLAVLTVRHALPTISSFRQFAAAGGLMSYGGSIADAYRQLGVYTGRILKGEKPANLPVVQSTKFEFVINLKTAKALGLTVPPSRLATADEVIE